MCFFGLKQPKHILCDHENKRTGRQCVWLCAVCMIVCRALEPTPQPGVFHCTAIPLANHDALLSIRTRILERFNPCKEFRCLGETLVWWKQRRLPWWRLLCYSYSWLYSLPIQQSPCPWVRLPWMCMHTYHITSKYYVIKLDDRETLSPQNIMTFKHYGLETWWPRTGMTWKHDDLKTITT